VGLIKPLPLLLVEACQYLRDRGFPRIRPDVVVTLLRGLARDGRDLDGGKGNLQLRKLSRDGMTVRLQRNWQVVEKSAEIRRRAAELLLGHLIGKVQKGTRGKDLMVETTLGALLDAVGGDAFLKGTVTDTTRLMDRALLWLHEHAVVTLGKGLTVFRPAITVRLKPGGGKFLQKDFRPLEEHYAEQTFQTHVMAEYAARGLKSMPEALRLSGDYFLLDKDAFVRRWMPGRGAELRRQTTSSSWNMIVKELGNPVQEEIVADDREQTNVLDPPPLKWSAVMFRKTEDQNGNETTQA